MFPSPRHRASHAPARRVSTPAGAVVVLLAAAAVAPVAGPVGPDAAAALAAVPTAEPVTVAADALDGTCTPAAGAHIIS